MKLFQKGFSIVELLVVIVTIGILASIVIISYRGIQNRGYDASIQSDLESTQGILEAYRARDDGSNDNHRYPPDDTTLATLSIKASKGAYDTSVNYNLIYCLKDSGVTAYKEYRLIGLSRSGAIFVIGQDGFVSNSLTAANLNSSVCNNSYSMTLVTSGLSAPDTWQAWVGG
jgi:prepilin-type N-terminal cleavage/methylation domain-containing protein